MRKIYNLSINRKLGLYFGILFVLILVNYSLITISNNTLRVDAASLEISRQLQSLTYSTSFFATNATGNDKPLMVDLNQAIRQFDQNLALLESGGFIIISETEVQIKPLPAQLHDVLQELKKNWKAQKQHLELISSNNGHNADVSKISTAQNFILQNTNSLYLNTQKLSQEYILLNLKRQKFIHLIIFSLSAINLAFLVLGFLFFRKSISNPLRKLIEAIKGMDKGNLNFDISHKYNDELGVLSQNLLKLKDTIEETTEFANSIGEGKFDVEFHEKSEEDKLSLALLNMRDNLQRVATEDSRRHWANEGMAKFSELLRINYNSASEMADVVISNLVKYLGANQGSFFSLNKDESGKQEEVLTLISAYAYNRKKFIETTIQIGEGLVGQAVQERDVMFLTDVPDSYVKIRSGLGEANPRNILIVPLMVNDEVYGVVEIASFNVFEKYQIDFVKSLSEVIAATLANTHANEKTKGLLEQSQQMARIMQEQEEEMRQNMEELQATQEEMERKHKEMERTEQQFKQLSANIEGMLYQFILRKDRSSGFIYASEGVKLLLGYSAEEFLSISIQNKIHKDDLSSFLNKTLANSAQNASEFIWEGRLITKTGEPKWVRLKSRPEHQPNGEIIWNGIALDATENREKDSALNSALEQIQEHEHELQKTIQQLQTLQQELEQKRKEVEELNTLIEKSSAAKENEVKQIASKTGNKNQIKQ